MRISRAADRLRGVVHTWSTIGAPGRFPRVTGRALSGSSRVTFFVEFPAFFALGRGLPAALRRRSLSAAGGPVLSAGHQLDRFRRTPSLVLNEAWRFSCIRGATKWTHGAA